jgi:hypothetical protein
MRYFFYGSLLDPATRARVLGRGLALEPARLEGWRRFRRRRLPWPMIRPCRGHCVAGALTPPLGASARQRLREYEGELYRARRVHVRRHHDSRRLPAAVFVPA